ncbi:Uncharacterised protein [Mycoplasmopsis maculosa]|uniref:Uncharacterized protein n=1 Tax=Mycoplasmopsis maculosa TaxID=114885 RepID=A0A449B406_9BACT|nr:hypothetical protein [Mycoplasmopsis maculosa]VEU75268.1 Uncharacterised protein [Mycoplasmopsis maculosa]
MNRDPEVCLENIEKRRKLLLKLHEENLYNLAHPALIREEDKPIEAKCNDPFCQVVSEEITKEEKKRLLTIRILGLVFSLILITMAILIAVLISQTF